MDADYHLSAKLDARGHASATVHDWKRKLLFKASHKQIAAERKGHPYRCPPTQFDFWGYILRKESFLGRTAKLQDVRVWLETVGGVHLYQIELRVSPNGNPGNDWLDINLRRVQSSEERPSTNNSIGRVPTELRVGPKSSRQLAYTVPERSSFLKGLPGCCFNKCQRRPVTMQGQKFHFLNGEQRKTGELDGEGWWEEILQWSFSSEKARKPGLKRLICHQL